MRIVHLTTVHPRTDTRIRVKQVASIACAFEADVYLFVQDGLGDERTVDGARVVDTGVRPQSRLGRMTIGAWRMWRAVCAAKPCVAHFHDPELIPVGLALKWAGVRVIYDVHEDLPRQILGKFWIWPWFRRPVSWVVKSMEWIAAQVFDGIVCATPSISERFPRRKTETVQNFPLLSELVEAVPIPFQNRPNEFGYIGGLTVARGAHEMVEALEMSALDTRLQVAGGFQPKALKEDLERKSGWQRVEFHGWVSRSGVAAILGRVRGGLVLFHAAPNHIDAQPNKMFEYMAAGVPVIGSDFPLWREIIAGSDCGMVVNPRDVRAIADAMKWLLANPVEAEAMGQRGRAAVEKMYNWTSESERLIRLYMQVQPALSRKRGSHG